MNRLRLALVGIVALVVASSCSVVDPPALTVGDWSISRADFIAELDAFDAAPQLGSAFGLVSSGSSSVGGTTTTSPEIATTNTAALANVHVQVQVTIDLGEHLGIPAPTEDEVATNRQQFESQMQAEVPPELDALMDQVGMAIAYQTAIEEQLLGDLDLDAEARAMYQQALDAGSLPEQTCIDVIVAAPDIVQDPQTGQAATPDPAALATSKQKADRLLAQLDAGADFNELAATESDDATSAAQRGDLGCFQAGQLNPTIEEPMNAVAVGEHSDVVDFGSGYAIIKVRSRGVLSFDDVAEELTSQVQQSKRSEVVGGAARDRARELEVSVDPLFGRWDAETGQVLTPEGAQPAPVTLLASTDAEPIAP